MYKLLFADDEKLVLSKISQMVDWESNGFTLEGCCSNGYEVMELIERELPDLAILDINMPFITGLEAARQIRHSYPRIRIVFLTGYTDFEFAKQAVELGALKYIVKPVAAEELQAVLREVRAALDEENGRIRKMADLEHFYQQNQKMLMQDLFGSGARSDTIYERVRACGLDWDEGTSFQVAVFGIDPARGADWTPGDEEAMLFALCNVVSELAQEAELGLACIGQGAVLLVGYSAGDHNFSLRMQEFVESVLQLTEKQLHFSVTAGLGNVYTGCAQIAASCAEAARTLSLRVKEGGNQLFTTQDLHECAGSRSAVWDAINYIEATYADPNLSADAVCEHLHLSPSYLRALFKQQTGGTIIGYITKARMERARTLLEAGKLKNGQIAGKVGYNDPHYFSYCFRRYFGVSPNDMREKLPVFGSVRPE